MCLWLVGRGWRGRVVMMWMSEERKIFGKWMRLDNAVGMVIVIAVERYCYFLLS